MVTSAVSWVGALPRPVGFVLSGGASLGAIQVGMLQALAEVGVEPDLVVGTSVGSLNGAVVAEHATVGSAADRLERVWRGLRRRDVFPGGPVAQALSTLRTGHLHPRDGIARLVRGALGARSFDQLARPLTVVAADVLTGHVRWFQSGELVPPLLAATAIPGVFPPVVVDGRHHWDAGARNRSLLDLDSSAELIEPTREVAADFLGHAEPPRPGHLCGAPHHHPPARGPTGVTRCPSTEPGEQRSTAPGGTRGRARAVRPPAGPTRARRSDGRGRRRAGSRRGSPPGGPTAGRRRRPGSRRRAAGPGRRRCGPGGGRSRGV